MITKNITKYNILIAQVDWANFKPKTINLTKNNVQKTVYNDTKISILAMIISC